MANGRESRKYPWLVAQEQPWASDQVVAQHVEALWLVGEAAMFIMMWRPQDHEAGLVPLCPSCSSDRSARAFNQPERKKCPICYGTTFLGGIRQVLLRPAIFNDRNIELVDGVRGTNYSDTIMIETTPDFIFHKGDYIFRGDGARFQAEEKGEGVLRTGFHHADTKESFRGTIPSARMEDPTAVAFILPPSPAEVREILSERLIPT